MLRIVLQFAFCVLMYLHTKAKIFPIFSCDALVMFHLWPWKCNGKYKQTGVREPFPSARLIPKAIVCLCFVSGSWPLSLLYLCSQVPAWWSKEETHVQNSCKLAYNFSARTVRENCTCQLLVFFWKSWALKILKLHILLSFPTQRFGCHLNFLQKRRDD